jgi:hypothetical protein
MYAGRGNFQGLQCKDHKDKGRLKYPRKCVGSLPNGTAKGAKGDCGGGYSDTDEAECPEFARGPFDFRKAEARLSRPGIVEWVWIALGKRQSK